MTKLGFVGEPDDAAKRARAAKKVRVRVMVRVRVRVRRCCEARARRQKGAYQHRQETRSRADA
jgi:hypothetical protein